MLSKIERGEKNPTLVVAAKLAHGLEVGFSALLGDPPPRSRITLISAAKQPVFRDPETGFERRLLAPTTPRHPIELVEHTIPAGASSGRLPPYGVGVEKRIVVEQGSLRLTVEHESHVVDHGDVVVFEADVEHELANAGSGVLRYLMVVSRPFVS